MKNKLTILYALFFSVQLMAQTDSNYINGEKIPCKEITLGCRILSGGPTGGKHVIKNETEYQALLANRSPHPDCSSYSLPFVDFTKYTLLGRETGVSGCKEPTSEHTIYYNQQQNTYVFELMITEHGLCQRLNHIKIWCLIPKISETAIIDFKIIEKTLDE